MKHGSSSHQTRTLFLVLGFCIALMTLAHAEDCPPCWYNQTPPNTSGNGTASDGRPILTVTIDSSWNVNNSGQPQAGTNSNIWNGLTGCSGCTPPTGAAGMWNEATGASGFGVNFNVQVNQGTQNPNIIIVRDDTITGCASITLEPPGGPYTMRIPTSTANLPLWGIVER